MKYIGEGTVGHIGKKTWNRLSHKQREVIKHDRANAAKHVAAFIREKDLRLGFVKKS